MLCFCQAKLDKFLSWLGQNIARDAAKDIECAAMDCLAALQRSV